VIENVVTDSAHRNKGLGTSVLRFAIDVALGQRCYKVMLSTGRTDEAILRFYEKAGFTRGGKSFFEIRRM
jgi:ribosomal protein S18 acetylase RimI-like enzyme